MVVSQIGGPQYRHQNIIVLIIGTHKVHLILGNLQIEILHGSLGWHWVRRRRSGPACRGEDFHNPAYNNCNDKIGGAGLRLKAVRSNLKKAFRVQD